MPEFFIPPKLPIAPPVPVIPISKTVTGTAAFLIGTTIGAQVPCIGVWLQSSAKDDSNGAMSGIAYVCMETVLDNGTFTVLCLELVTGQETWIPIDHTKHLKIKTQTGTAWVRGFAIPVQSN